jgi:predicted short-subunit dehydrogenase-like oxidoreductase (DUF2520 family)
MKIIIIGTGNVGTTYGRLFIKAGYQIAQVYGRNEKHAQLLASEFNSSHCSAWNDINKEADLYIAALSDKALSEMSVSLTLPGQLIVHTAGAIPMNILKPVSEKHGVMYPLQSVRKEFPPASDIPFLVNGSDELVQSTLLRVAADVSPIVQLTSDEARAKLHVAAVIVNNFTNHLYAMAEAFCKNESLNFKLLLPLIQETAERMYRITPTEALTGPAIRNDQVTIDKHLELLSAYPALKKFYEDFSRSIREFRS